MSVEVGFRQVGGTEVQKVDDQNPFPVTVIQAAAAAPLAWANLHVAAGTATTVVKTGAGILHAIAINTKGATGNTLTVYDGLTSAGRVVAIIDTTGGTAVLVYDAALTVGLTLVSATGTGADYTVAYL